MKHTQIATRIITAISNLGVIFVRVWLLIEKYASVRFIYVISVCCEKIRALNVRACVVSVARFLNGVLMAGAAANVVNVASLVAKIVRRAGWFHVRTVEEIPVRTPAETNVSVYLAVTVWSRRNMKHKRFTCFKSFC